MSHDYPDIPAFRAALLAFIRRHDGKATWYQLDRAVVFPGFPHLITQLMPVLRAMEAEGEIETVPNPQIEGLPCYRSRTAASPPAT